MIITRGYGVSVWSPGPLVTRGFVGGSIWGELIWLDSDITLQVDLTSTLSTDVALDSELQQQLALESNLGYEEFQ